MKTRVYSVKLKFPCRGDIRGDILPGPEVYGTLAVDYDEKKLVPEQIDQAVFRMEITANEDMSIRIHINSCVKEHPAA